DVVALDEPVDGEDDVRVGAVEEVARDAVALVAEDERRRDGEVDLGDGDGAGVEVGGDDAVAPCLQRVGGGGGVGPDVEVEPLVRALALAAGAPEAPRQPSAAGAGLVQLAPGEPRGGLALEPDE